MANHTTLETILLQALRDSHDEDRTRWATMIAGARGQSYVNGDDADLVSTDGGTIDADEYEVDVAAGDVLIGGTHGTIDALDDKDLLDANDTTTIDLDGVAVTSADAIDNGQSVVVVMLAVLISGTPSLVFVMGAAATTGSQVTPTPEQCRKAIELAGISGLNASGLGIVLGTITIKRVQVLTLLYSGTPEVGDDMNVTVNGVDTTHTADGTTLNDEVGDLRSALTTDLAAEPVTVGGTAATITITADDGETFTYAADIVLTATGDLAVADTDGETVSMTHSDPSADDTVKGRRLAGALAD